MSNTLGTMLRAFWIMTYLIAGWFIVTTALYAAAAMGIGISFSWGHAGIFFGFVVLSRMLYPRNAFEG